MATPPRTQGVPRDGVGTQNPVQESRNSREASPAAAPPRDRVASGLLAKDAPASSAPSPQLSSVVGGTTRSQSIKDLGSQTLGRRQPEPPSLRASWPVAPALQLPSCALLPITSLPGTGQVGESGIQKPLEPWAVLHMAGPEALPYLCGWLILNSCLLVGAQVRAGAPAPASPAHHASLGALASLQHRAAPHAPASPLGGRSQLGVSDQHPGFRDRECTAGRDRTLFFHVIAGVLASTTLVVFVCRQFTIVFESLKLLKSTMAQCKSVTVSLRCRSAYFSEGAGPNKDLVRYSGVLNVE